jgi:high affinity Mn2+ porin
LILITEIFKRLCRVCGTVASFAVTFALCLARAHAADLPVKAPPQPADYDWTGFYVGGHVGLATGNSPWTLAPIGGGAPVAGSFSLYKSPDAFKESGSWFEGVQGGYNYMLRNRLLLGIEIDGSFPTFADPVTGLTTGGISNFTSPGFGAGTFSENVLASGTVRGRIGYAPGHWLFYATGGLAWSYDQQTLTQNVTGNTEDRFLYRFGWAAGLASIPPSHRTGPSAANISGPVFHPCRKISRCRASA